MTPLSQTEIERMFRMSALRSYARREAALKAEQSRILGSKQRWAILAGGAAIAMIVLALFLLMKVAQHA